MSRTMARKSSRSSRSPAILRCRAGIEPGGSACDTVTGTPSAAPNWAKASSDSPSSPQPTIEASSTTFSVARMRRPLADTSTFASAWKPSARYRSHSRCR